MTDKSVYYTSQRYAGREVVSVPPKPSHAFITCCITAAPRRESHAYRRTHIDMKLIALLAVAAATVCLASAQSNCPDGWEDFSDDAMAPICLDFVRASANFAATRAYCQALGSDLAKLTGDLHQKVIKYINDQPEGDLDDKGIWIGGTDQVVEGEWRWVTDNTLIPMGTPHWYRCTDQPSGGTKKNCLCIFTPDFYFHDCTCEYDYYGICQL